MKQTRHLPAWQRAMVVCPSVKTAQQTVLALSQVGVRVSTSFFWLGALRVASRRPQGLAAVAEVLDRPFPPHWSGTFTASPPTVAKVKKTEDPWLAPSIIGALSGS
jgi:hypothetical protein